MEVPISAVIDAVAGVTLISDQIFENLCPKPTILKKVTMHTAARDSNMTGLIVGLGSENFEERVYVAPIEDDMLLGIDIMGRHGLNIDIGNQCIVTKNQKLPINSNSKWNSPKPKVAKVLIAKHTVIPPNSFKFVKCVLSTELDNNFIKPAHELNLWSPRSYHSSSRDQYVCMINLSDGYMTLKKNEVVAEATEASGVLGLKENEGVTVNKVQGTTASTQKRVGELESFDPTKLPSF